MIQITFQFVEYGSIKVSLGWNIKITQRILLGIKQMFSSNLKKIAHVHHKYIHFNLNGELFLAVQGD